MQKENVSAIVLEKYEKYFKFRTYAVEAKLC